jgi:pimeloyl-ACP methyl ester carboxylesterase
MGVISMDKARRERRTRGDDAAIDVTAPAQGMFTTPDGAELYYEDTGAPDGDAAAPTMFYIYGLGCSIRHWKYPMAHFGPGGLAHHARRQIWMDFRGHGRSKAPLAGQRVTMARLCEDIRALCRFRGIQRATFLGQSLGGTIALQLAYESPELVAALVLLASPGRDVGAFLPAQPVSRMLWQGLIRVNRAAPLAVRLGYALSKPYRELPPVKLLLREVIRYNGFNPKLSRTDDIEEYIERIFQVSPTAFCDLAGDLARFDVARLEPPIECPALIVAGERDLVVPIAEAHRLAEHLPNSELFVMPHGSHCPHFDDPTTVNRRIEAFLSGHGL